MVLAAILSKNPKNGQKWDFDPCYLENSPTYSINIYDIVDKTDGEKFESKEKTGNGSSFVRYFDEKPSITTGNRSVFREFEAHRTRGASAMPPLTGSTPNTPSVFEYHFTRRLSWA